MALPAQLTTPGPAHDPWPSTDSAGPLAQMLGKVMEAILKKRRAVAELQREEGNKGQVASGRGGRHHVGREEPEFPFQTVCKP